LSNHLKFKPQAIDEPLSPPPSHTFLFSLAAMAKLVGEWSPTFEKPHPEAATLFTDASLDGWGAVLCLSSGEVHATGERWTNEETTLDISVLECFGVRNGIEAFYDNLVSVGRLEIRVDNSSTEAGLRRGVARAENLNAALGLVLDTLAKELPSCRVSVGYVPTKDNPADGPSRGRAPGPVPRSCQADARPLRTSA